MSEAATNNCTQSRRELYFTPTAAAPSAVEIVGHLLQICTVHHCAILGIYSPWFTYQRRWPKVTFCTHKWSEWCESAGISSVKIPNISKGTIKQVHRRVGNRTLHLQEVASITEVLIQKKPTGRDLIEVSNWYADEKQREYTAGLNFFLEKFGTIPPPSLFETVILQKNRWIWKNLAKDLA